MQSEVLVHVVAIGPLAEDCVADGSCGRCWSFGRRFSGSSAEAVGSLEESWMVACLQQSSFWQVAKWQLTYVGAVNGFMQQLLDFGSLVNSVPATSLQFLILMNSPWVMVAVPSSIVCVPVALVASSVSLIGL